MGRLAEHRGLSSELALSEFRGQQNTAGGPNQAPHLFSYAKIIWEHSRSWALAVSPKDSRVEGLRIEL